MKNILFIDGGGTKTKAAIMDSSSLEIKFSKTVAKMSNLFVSVEKTKEAFEAVAEEVKEKEIDEIHISLAGYAKEVEEHKNFVNYVKEIFSNENIEVYKDIEFLTRAFCNDESEMVAIFGTGSAYSFLRSGEVKIKGGFGHIFGDEGSAYSFAKEIILMVIEKIDSNHEEHELVKFVFDYFGCETLNCFKANLYSDKGKSHIASIAAEIISNEKFEDITEKIFKGEIIKIRNKISIIGLSDNLKEIYLDGGFVRNNPKFKEMLIKSFNDKKVNLIDWENINETNPMVRICKK